MYLFYNPYKCETRHKDKRGCKIQSTYLIEFDNTILGVFKLKVEKIIGAV